MVFIEGEFCRYRCIRYSAIHLTKGSYTKCFLRALELWASRRSNPWPLYPWDVTQTTTTIKLYVRWFPFSSWLDMALKKFRGCITSETSEKSWSHWHKIAPSETLFLIVDTVGRELLNYYVIAQLSSWRRKRNTLWQLLTSGCKCWRDNHAEDRWAWR